MCIFFSFLTDYIPPFVIQEEAPGKLDKLVSGVSAFLELVDVMGDLTYLFVANHLHWLTELLLLYSIYLPISNIASF